MKRNVAEAKIKNAVKPSTANLTAEQGEVIIRFSDVSFSWGANKPILDEVGFSIRERAKIALMGQNGAGKSTLFQLITGASQPEEGTINIQKGVAVGIARQVIPKEQLAYTVLQFFENAFDKKVYNIEPRIKDALEVVNLHASLDKKIGQFSGGQQARLLLAFAIIQNPDILLLDEPTNNLDKQGIQHLTKFLVDYKKTVMVISHDAKFLNAFTQGVLYLDSFNHKVEQYVGNYLHVVEEIKARIERERRENARLQKDIINRKEQMNFFAQKGGHMRDVARKMGEAIEELEEEVVETRQEDRTIRPFFIQTQDISDAIVTIKSVNVAQNHKVVAKKVSIILKKRNRLLIAGPNGIGKSTLLEALATGKSKEAKIAAGVKIGYYRQDFSGFDFDQTVYKTLSDANTESTDHEVRSVAAHFLLNEQALKHKVGSLSEGQKGLLSFARFVLQKPGLLILDEPTNHINFRHLPVIADALNKYEGAMILVSHMPEFVEQVKVDETLDLGAL